MVVPPFMFLWVFIFLKPIFDILDYVSMIKYWATKGPMNLQVSRIDEDVMTQAKKMLEDNDKYWADFLSCT